MFSLCVGQHNCVSESFVQRDLLPIEKLTMDIRIITDNQHNSSKKSFNNKLSALAITYKSINGGSLIK